MKKSIAAAAAAISVFAAGKCMAMENGDTLFFDFGKTPEYGWTTVTSDTKYSKDTGYGFSMISFVEDEICSGGGVLADAVKFDSLYAERVTFDVDLEPGIYELSVYSGNINRMTVTLEGKSAIIDMEFSNTEGRVEIPVKDGTLNLGLTRGSAGKELSVSALSITKKSGLGERKKRVFICGDSLAATYYPQFVSQPLEAGYRGGWGQMLGAFLPDTMYAHDLSSSGMTANGFLESGRLDTIREFSEPGDHAVISFGYNDHMTDSADEYKAAMEKILSELKDMGVKPIVCSELCESGGFGSDGSYTAPDNRYEAEARATAENAGVPYIDLHRAHADYMEDIGLDGAMSLFWQQWDGSSDTIHPNRNGAGQAARIFVKECIDSGLTDFEGKLRGSGISENYSINCRTSGNSVYAENLAPYPMPVTLVTNRYLGGKLSDTDSTFATLPAYDVLAPQPETELYAPFYVRTSRSFIFGKNFALPL